MQRYFLAKDQFHHDEVVITGEDARHLLKVMRCRIGDLLIACNGLDREVLAKVSRLGEGTVTATIIEELPMQNEARVQVWIAQSLPKSDKMDMIIQKCTEIGATRFLPFVSKRTIVQYDAKKERKRLDRWHKIAKEAAEQAHRNRIPTIDAPRSWRELLAMIPQVRVAWICYEQAADQDANHGIKGALSAFIQANGEDAGPLMLIIGPEGGFDADEVAEAEAVGAQSIGLGRRILRTETAAMVGLTAILYEYGEIGGE